MAQFMFNKLFNTNVRGYRYDDNDADHATSLVQQAIEIEGSIVLFDEATNITRFGYWMRNQYPEGGALPKGKFTQNTGSDGAGGNPVPVEYPINDPHETTPQRSVAHTTRTRVAGQPLNGWSAGQWLYYLVVNAVNSGSGTPPNFVQDNTGDGSAVMDNAHTLMDRWGFLGHSLTGGWGLWKNDPLVVGNNPPPDASITFAPGLKWKTFKVDDIDTGLHVGYLPAIVIDTENVNVGFGLGGPGVINMDHQLVYVPYIFEPAADFSGYLDQNLGPTNHVWDPR